jgi:ElaB/YqjD/DUF883 family membrane-anchored ribosome-binding protein
MTPEEEDLFGELEDVFADVDDTVEDFTKLSVEELLNIHAECDEYIKKNRQVLRPNTREARDVHSRRDATWVILHERGIL